MEFQVAPIEGPVGASVTSIDLSVALDNASFERLAAAWNKHAVLVFRDQQLTPEQLVAFSERFGALEIHVLDQYLHPEYPEILVVSNIIENGRHVGISDAGIYWHSDLSYMAEPSRGSILYAIKIPQTDGQTLGDTLWANTAAAYDALDPETRHRIDGLKATFSLANRFDKLVEDGDKNAILNDTQKAKTQEVVHPVVRTHPVTGRKCIFVNEAHTARIVGMTEDASRSLLEMLWAHCTRPEFLYRHRWRPGDVVMWDNIPTQHIAIRDYELPQQRYLFRTTLTGDRPF